jgi:hypothetical protein
MPDRMNDDLTLGDFVKDEIGVRRRRHAADCWIERAAANVGTQQQKIGEGLDAGLNPPGTLRRMGGDVIEDRQVPGGCSGASQTVLSPHRAHLLVSREFAAGSASL